LSRGRQAIYLLPEIALTPQTLQRITARFGAAAAALHSALSAGERCRVHEAAARGELQVVVGPRSALFVPLPDLGVVVVDEEHETSYKQEDKPRYHARYAALVRARECGAVALLGSATPDLESFRNGRTGRYRLVALPDRQGGELPPVDIVDMRGTFAADGISPQLSLAIADTLEARRQVILYFNRRGFARVLQCSECGTSEACPHCDIALTYHLRPARLLCHYCGFQRAVTKTCDQCDATSFLPAGGGTERLELALRAAFPEARVLRLDQDATRRRGSHGQILATFAAGDADILVGTQMVAKGHHFPGVDLVGVLAADDGLSLPDFRASERTFQLLTQVAGRAGRSGPGRVVFQTYQPESPVILNAAAHDYATFVAVELGQRRQLGYPPFRRLLRIGVSGRRRGLTETTAGVLADAVRDALARKGRTILGPAPGVLPRLQDRYRFQILIKGGLVAREKRWLAECVRSLLAEHRGCEAHLDVDPVGLY
jgi:primosomal protein N' (replication factor Y)